MENKREVIDNEKGCNTRAKLGCFIGGASILGGVGLGYAFGGPMGAIVGGPLALATVAATGMVIKKGTKLCQYIGDKNGLKKDFLNFCDRVGEKFYDK